MSDGTYKHLMFQAEHGRLVGFSTAGRGGKTTVKLEMEFTDGYALADFLRSAQDAQEPPRKSKAAPAPPK